MPARAPSAPPAPAVAEAPAADGAPDGADAPAATARRRTGYLMLAAGMALVGSYVALSRPLTERVPVALLATLRFAIGALAMLPWLARGPHDAPLDARLLRELALQSLFGNFLFSLLMLTGVSMTSATASGVVLSLLPAAVALLSALVLRERLSARGWAAVALAVAGVMLLAVAAPSRGGDDSLAGIALVAGCVVCEAVYVILGKRLTGRLSPRRISALINLCGLALMLPLGLAQARGFEFGRLSPGDWVLLVFYGLAASVWSTWLWLSGLARVPASHSGVFTIALPITAMTVGVVFLGERPQWIHAAAFGCAVAAVVMIAGERDAGRRR